MIKFNVHGLKCDNPNCQYQDMSIAYEEYHDFINCRCPICDSILLTKKDYRAIRRVKSCVDTVNKIIPKCRSRKLEKESIFSGKVNYPQLK